MAPGSDLPDEVPMRRARLRGQELQRWSSAGHEEAHLLMVL